MAATATLRLAREHGPKAPLRAVFTKRLLESIKPGEGQRWAYDATCAGLAYLVTPAGARTFYVAKRIKGRYRRVKIGPFPTVTIEQARKAAARLLGEVASGHNPADRRRAERAEATIGATWAAYRDEHLIPRCSPRTAQAEQYLFERHLRPVATRKLSDLSPADAKALHSKIGSASKTSANRSLQLLRRLYRYAARHYGYEGRNPTPAVELYRERSRERFLSAEELPKFLAACDAEGQPWADFFRLCLFVGARRSNIQAMRWQHLDLQGRVWTLPGDETKNGRDTRVPLTTEAVEILERRRAEQADKPSDYVFPPLRDKGRTLHLSQPARPFDRICARAGITGLTIHDLRRSCGAWLAATGASLPIIGKMLGHADLRATQIYARLDLEPVAAAMAAASSRMARKK